MYTILETYELKEIIIRAPLISFESYSPNIEMLAAKF